MTLTESPRPGNFILSEANGRLSRDNITVRVPANTTMPAGTVLGQISANGKYAAYDDAATDGTETAAGILYAPLSHDENTTQDVTGVVINKDAEVRADDLVWEEGVDESGGTADLLTLGIKARD